MIQRAALAASALVLAVVLLFNFHGPEQAPIVALANDPGGVASNGGTGTGAGVGTGSGTGTGTGTGSSSSGGAAGSSAGGSGTGASTTGGSGSGTFQGQDISMPYGDVQVQITVKNGKITDIQPLIMPVGGHSGRIADYAAPILRSEALQAQSSNINIVSGATYTSEAYAMSLQSALDAAHI